MPAVGGAFGDWPGCCSTEAGEPVPGTSAPPAAAAACPLGRGAVADADRQPSCPAQALLLRRQVVDSLYRG